MTVSAFVFFQPLIQPDKKSNSRVDLTFFVKRVGWIQYYNTTYYVTTYYDTTALKSGGVLQGYYGKLMGVVEVVVDIKKQPFQ